jgi:hypothetical protein
MFGRPVLAAIFVGVQIVSAQPATTGRIVDVASTLLSQYWESKLREARYRYCPVPLVTYSGAVRTGSTGWCPFRLGIIWSEPRQGFTNYWRE